MDQEKTLYFNNYNKKTIYYLCSCGYSSIKCHLSVVEDFECPNDPTMLTGAFCPMSPMANCPLREVKASKSYSAGRDPGGFPAKRLVAWLTPSWAPSSSRPTTCRGESSGSGELWIGWWAKAGFLVIQSLAWNWQFEHGTTPLWWKRTILTRYSWPHLTI